MIDHSTVTNEMIQLRADTVRQAVLAIEKGSNASHRIRIDGDPAGTTFDATILVLPEDRVAVLATLFDVDNVFLGLRVEGYDVVDEVQTLTATPFTAALEIAARRELHRRAQSAYQTAAAA
ncbi:hypothetical protein ACRAWC_01705 [Leifsonia sp. L25]|uniref:hypothetical protein n=1 Tax=Actinomycetes TaxID=1760 RepID=UPI003D69AF53